MTNREIIKSGLKERRVTQTQIAGMLKVTPVSVNDVITGKRKTPRIRQAVALALGKSVNEIWPELAEEEKE